jgi:hypothetical protein
MAPNRCAFRWSGERLSLAVNGWIFQAAVTKDRPADHYTPRGISHFEALAPLDAREILWLS